MKTLWVLIIALFFFSFCPTSEKDEETNTKSGYYIFVEDYLNRENHKYLVASKDSVDKIFNHFFASELELGTVDHPISIYNLKHSFYIERVKLFEAKNGKTKFKHLKYQSIYKASKKRKQQDPANF